MTPHACVNTCAPLVACLLICHLYVPTSSFLYATVNKRIAFAAFRLLEIWKALGPVRLRIVTTPNITTAQRSAAIVAYYGTAQRSSLLTSAASASCNSWLRLLTATAGMASTQPKEGRAGLEAEAGKMTQQEAGGRPGGWWPGEKHSAYRAPSSRVWQHGEKVSRSNARQAAKWRGCRAGHGAKTNKHRAWRGGSV